MEGSEKTNVIIYRVREKGLEVFMVPNETEGENWSLPEGSGEVIALKGEDRVIPLNPVEQSEGLLEQAYAVEADWHEIPSMKDILRHDVRFMKDTIKQMLPDVMQKGAFVAIKDAFRRVMPHQYQMLKELKEILIDRNLTKYM